MSRSRKKTPIIGNACCDSEKQWKQFANRTFRRHQKWATQQGDDVLPLLREISDVWYFGKDGKQYCGDTEWEKKSKRK